MCFVSNNTLAMANYGKEIITLQFGHYSNFVGTHWWNCQEGSFDYRGTSPSEINNDVLFREGQTKNGEITFTPRMLLVDLKGSLGTLPEDGGLYDPPQPPNLAQPLWSNDKVKLQAVTKLEKNEFLQDLEQAMSVEEILPEGLKEQGLVMPKRYYLEDSIKVWSDYLRIHLHPRNISLVNEYQHNGEITPFDNFKIGEEVWKNPTFEDEFTNRIRCYMEECDNLQLWDLSKRFIPYSASFVGQAEHLKRGFHVLLDAYNGFSGIASSNLEYLRDEYSTKAVLAFPCIPAIFPDSTNKQNCARVINLALSMSSLAEHTSLFAPLSCAGQCWRETGSYQNIPHLNYKVDQWYHTSSIIASALDTLSLPYRLHSNQIRLSDLTNNLRIGGRVAVAASLSLPFPMQKSSSLLKTLEQWEGPLFHSITPHCNVGNVEKDNVCIQALSLRGVPEARLKNDVSYLDESNPAYHCHNINELIQAYLSFCGTTAKNIISTANTPLSTASPFPNIFNDNITANGFLDTEVRVKETEVSHVPVLAGLHSTKNVGDMLSSLHTEAKRINIRTLFQFTSSGLESTELSESLEQLLCLSECYADQGFM